MLIYANLINKMRVYNLLRLGSVCSLLFVPWVYHHIALCNIAIFVNCDM